MASAVPFFGNFNFLVEIEDLTGDSTSVVGGFSRVSGIESRSEIVEHRVGSSPHVHKLQGKTRFGNILLEKGCTASGDLYDWRRRIENGEEDRRSGSIILLDGNMKEQARFNFFDAWPCRYEAPVLDASDTAISIEKLELVVSRVERVEPKAK
jgi:phage tail-like protein